jgi:hypothetical protein
MEGHPTIPYAASKCTNAHAPRTTIAHGQPAGHGGCHRCRRSEPDAGTWTPRIRPHHVRNDSFREDCLVVVIRATRSQSSKRSYALSHFCYPLLVSHLPSDFYTLVSFGSDDSLRASRFLYVGRSRRV